MEIITRPARHKRRLYSTQFHIGNNMTIPVFYVSTVSNFTLHNPLTEQVQGGTT